MIHMRNLPSTDTSVFMGKKRNIHLAVQGKFKRRVRWEEVIEWQEGERASGRKSRQIINRGHMAFEIGTRMLNSFL